MRSGRLNQQEVGCSLDVYSEKPHKLDFRGPVGLLAECAQSMAAGMQ